jgi:phage pi2 protein 07
VIGVHDDEEVVDIRDEYGDVDEIDFDEWERMDLVLCATPRDWRDRDDELEEPDEMNTEIRRDAE